MPRRRGARSDRFAVAAMPYGAGNVPKSLVATEIEGKRYTGFYTVVSGIITVESDWGELRAHAGEKTNATASRLFLEILRGAKSRGELDEDGK